MAKKLKPSEPEKTVKRGRKIKTIEALEADIRSQRLSIKSMVNSGDLASLKQLEPLFTKAMADELGVNHGSFTDKLRNPIKFSYKDIHRLGLYFDLNPDKLSAQINLEVRSNSSLIEKLSKFKKVRDLRQYNPENKKIIKI